MPVGRPGSPGKDADTKSDAKASRKDLEEQLPRLKPFLAPKGLLWVTYPKGTSKLKSDINRDGIAAYALTIGLQAVAMISVDEDLSALRLKVV